MKIRLFHCGVLLATALLNSCSNESSKPGSISAEPSTESVQLDRTTLPIKEPSYAAITELDARKAKAPPRFEVKAPAKAPNVVVVLIDDIGFGSSSAFGRLFMKFDKKFQLSSKYHYSGDLLTKYYNKIKVLQLCSCYNFIVDHINY